jgi:hypothetical protein
MGKNDIFVPMSWDALPPVVYDETGQAFSTRALYKQYMDTKKKLDVIEDERDKMLEGLEMVGWPCRLEELPALYQKLAFALSELHDIVYPLARLARNTDGLFPSTWGQRVSQWLLKLRNYNQERYDREVML